MEKRMNKRRLVDLHNSWLVINSVVGCNNGCKYCFLGNKQNCSIPRVLASPEDVVRELIHYEYYDKSIPLCLFPNTDIFLNQNNINYLLETLDILEKYQIENDIVIITKCLIPEHVLGRLKRMQENGYTVVVYLSYSGLGHEVEPNVNHNHIRMNFINLKRYRIPCVHYYRPFLPSNSDPKKIKSILDFVHKYTPVTVVTGFMFHPYHKDFFFGSN